MIMKLVASSTPGAIERDDAIEILTTRALLTRMVCREMLEANGNYFGRRPRAALGLLLGWIQDNFSECVVIEPHARDGLDSFVVPDSYTGLFQEIKDGAGVAEALFMLMTADTKMEVDHDKEAIRKALLWYWQNHEQAVLC